MSRLRVTWLLGNNLLKPSYSRLLVLGTGLAIMVVLIVMSLFANYYAAVENATLGIQAHVSIHKDPLSPEDQQHIKELLTPFDKQIALSAPGAEVVLDASIAEVENQQVQCTEGEAPERCFDPLLRATSYHGPVRIDEGFRIKREKVASISLRGVTVQDGKTVIDVERVLDVKTGEGDLERLQQGPRESMRRACLFDRMLVYGATKLDDFLVSFPALEDEGQFHVFRLHSTINLGMRRGESSIFITSLENVQDVLHRPGYVNLYEIRLLDAGNAERIRDELARQLEPTGMEVRSWADQDEAAFRLLHTLRWVIFVAVFNVIVIAALSIVSTLSLTVIQNKKKFSILRSMGLRDSGIYATLASKCLGIGLTGLAIGIPGGYLGSHLLLKIPGFERALSIMGVSQVRVMLDSYDVSFLFFSTLALYVVVALYPAREACQIDPIENL